MNIKEEYPIMNGETQVGVAKATVLDPTQSGALQLDCQIRIHGMQPNSAEPIGFVDVCANPAKTLVAISSGKEDEPNRHGRTKNAPDVSTPEARAELAQQVGTQMLADIREPMHIRIDNTLKTISELATSTGVAVGGMR